MACQFLLFLLLQSLICKVISSYSQPSIQQYVHLTGHPQTVTIPASSANQITRTNIAVTNQPRPATGVPSFSALALPNLVSNLMLNQPQISNELTSLPGFTLSNLVSNLPASSPRPTPSQPSYSLPGLPNLVPNLQQYPEQPKTHIKSPNQSSIDSNLLNNLAIALQLLIVSNILNSPPPNVPSKSPAEMKTYPDPVQNSLPQSVMPNANFVGNTGFSDPIINQNHKPTRNSMTLLSPYEALGSTSTYSESLPKYNSNPRQNFVSPYTMIDKDLFSMDNLF